MPITDILHNPTRQALVERSSCILKEMLIKQKEKQRPCKDRLNSALLTFFFLKEKSKKGEKPQLCYGNMFVLIPGVGYGAASDLPQQLTMIGLVLWQGCGSAR